MAKHIEQIEQYIYRRDNGRLIVRIPDGSGGKTHLGTFADTANGKIDARAARDNALKEEDEKTPEAGPDLVSDTEELNTRIVEGRVDGIFTIPALLAFCKVDLNVWAPFKGLVNKWPVGAKSKVGTLHWEDGVVSGDLEYAGIKVTPLIQVKVWLQRIQPIAVFPAICPVQVNTTYRPSVRPNTTGVSRALVFGDPHFGYTKNLQTARLRPFHDRRAMDLLVQLAAHLQPDRIDGIGDILDLAEWSDRFVRRPEFYDTTQPAILETHWWLKQLRAAAPNAEITLFAGNHEKRIERAQIANLRASYALRAADELSLPPALSPARLLGLGALGIDWIDEYPGGTAWLSPRVQVGHGATATVETARAIANKSFFTMIYAHTHRRERYARVINTREGTLIIEAANAGCLCHTDYRVPGHTKTQNWQQGVSVADYDEKGINYDIHLVAIEQGRMMYDGKVFEATESREGLLQDLPGWNW